MRKVIDSNYLRSPELSTYLSRGPAYQIVLTEFILMEQFKTNAALTVKHSLRLCSTFPRQVLTLKRSPEILRLSTRAKGLASRLIDTAQTAAFAKFCSLINSATPLAALNAHIGQREAESASHMAALLDDARFVPEIFDRLSQPFTSAELQEIRQLKPLGRSTQEKLMETVFVESKRLYLATDIESHHWPYARADAVNSFPFRYALCLTLLYMRWIRDGRQRHRAAEKVRNDIVDANTAAFATYFDGVLTNDQKVESVHAEARYLLTEIGAYVGGRVKPF